MHYFVKFIDEMNRKVGLVAAFIIIITSLILLYEVVARYAFNAPTIWAHDLSRYTFGIYSVYGGAYALLRNAHVGVDLFTKSLSPRSNAALDVFTSIFFFLFLLVLVWYGGELMWTSITRLENSQTAFSIPVYPIKILTFIGLVLFTLQGVAKLIRDLYFAVKGRVMA